MKIIKKIVKNILIILINVICLFGLKMILPVSNDNNSTNNTNQNNIVYTNKM